MVMVRRNLFKGHEYLTVRRETSKRDRHGDYLTEVSEHKIGPCSIAWGSDWGSTSERRINISTVTERDVSAYFNQEPDVRIEDKVLLPFGKRYRVVNVEPWKFRSNGLPAGWVVTLSGIESEGGK